MRNRMLIVGLLLGGLGCEDLRVDKTPEAGSMAGAVARAGSGGRSESAAGSGGRAEAGKGGRGAAAGSGGAGAAAVSGGSAGAPAAAAGDCADVMNLPQDITADMTVGPGCVRIPDHTSVSRAILTIAPGTRVLIGANGFLSAGTAGGIVAKGTAEEPIVFTSAASEPKPGDWGCVGFSSQADTSSSFEHVTFEYGGAPCRRDGSSYQATLATDVTLRGLTSSRFQHNAHAGLGIRSGDIRELTDVEFSDNEHTPISIAISKLTSIGTGMKFEDGDHIQVENTTPRPNGGTIRNQGIPFHIRGSTGLGAAGMPITIEAGVVFKLSSGTLQLNGDVDVQGTADAPVRFTSVLDDPGPGDWGCIQVVASGATVKIDHAQFEYGGSGQGCTGGSYKVALVTNNTTTVTNSQFSKLTAHAIESPQCKDQTVLCANMIDVPNQKLLCGSTPTDCL